MEFKRLGILFLIMFMIMVGFSILFPVLPYYIEQFGATSLHMGLLMSIYSVMQFIFSPFWGNLSDRVGRKPVLLVGLAGFTLSFVFMALSTELWMLFAARVFAGVLSSAALPTAMAYVADSTDPKARAKGMGIIGAAMGLGVIFGPAIGGGLSTYGLHVPFYASATVTALTFLIALLRLPESRPGDGAHRARAPFWALFTGPHAILYTVAFVVSFAMAGLESTLAFYASDRFGLTSTSMGWLFAFLGLVMAIVLGGLIGRFTRIFGEVTLMRAGLLISAIGFALIVESWSTLTLSLFLAVFGAGNAFIRPTVSALISRRSPADRQGLAIGMLDSADSLGRITGPAVGGWAYHAVSIASPYWIGSTVSLLALVLALLALQPEAQEQAA